jgi:voltage-gated potassium channel
VEIKTVHKIRQIVFSVLHKPQPNNRWARWVNYFLGALIVLNCTAVALETVPDIYLGNELIFHWIETISTAIFMLEYGARIWTCVEQVRFSSPLGRLHYAIKPLPLLDLAVIATYFAPVDLRFLRIFRLTRLLRVFGLTDYDQSLISVLHALSKRKHLLLVSVTMMLIAVYCTAATLYMVEHAAQPTKFSSIPETLWWAVVTLTTIGYGDVTPITPLGKLLAGASAIFGIGVFALPTAIMTAAILDAGIDSSAECPHCGKSL